MDPQHHLKRDEIHRLGVTGVVSGQRTIGSRAHTKRQLASESMLVKAEHLRYHKRNAPLQVSIG